jgi:hypothetical protein
MELAVVQGGDSGVPVVQAAPHSLTARAFHDLAASLSESCALRPALA